MQGRPGKFRQGGGGLDNILLSLTYFTEVHTNLPLVAIG